MQSAIENYIEIESKKLVLLEDIHNNIDRVTKSEIEKARKKQRIQWRKLNK